MKKRIALITVTVASLMSTATLVSAASINLLPNDPSESWNVQNVEQWATTGNKMDGISVTAYFGSESQSQTVLWADNTGAIGTGWSLTMRNPYYTIDPTTQQQIAVNGYNDNTWFSDAWWLLSNTSDSPLTSLVIDGRSGNTAFDIIYDRSDEKSPGSENGRTVVANLDISENLNVDAHYSTQVFVNGIFYGDLYQTLTFDFGQGLQTEQSFWFATDTDNVKPVPEPATMLLFGIGAMGIAAFRKRKDN